MLTYYAGVEFDGRYAHVGTFPIGIDPEQFIKVALAEITYVPY
jgi:trehalose-6-phosphate synthase